MSGGGGAVGGRGSSKPKNSASAGLVIAARQPQHVSKRYRNPHEADELIISSPPAGRARRRSPDSRRRRAQRESSDSLPPPPPPGGPLPSREPWRMGGEEAVVAASSAVMPTGAAEPGPGPGPQVDHLQGQNPPGPLPTHGLGASERESGAELDLHPPDSVSVLAGYIHRFRHGPPTAQHERDAQRDRSRESEERALHWWRAAEGAEGE
eukprot:CAMPEP_0205905234 /NCGR_PEP_ID=MMETSP1325-20131115/1227_1 /ASSEMBLY_ACC=CAM_ASM_000708 /TAXON_ID=236786 /ORGANISM="Florenciella sp., Strain RCC1007" /LENGTH=208 /DNA_ID=CAMNT_0053271121 /DNA_START=206 /DNA_END=829 /DNA_ORIENTATION=+